MRISQMTNNELLDNIIIWSAQEAQIVPQGNGRGNSKRKKLLDSIERAKQEVLNRLDKVSK